MKVMDAGRIRTQGNILALILEVLDDDMGLKKLMNWHDYRDEFGVLSDYAEG